MIRIKLPRGEWHYDPSELLGHGGLGDVFAGTSDRYGRLALKKIRLTAEDMAHRELRIADELADRQLIHVMPVLDSGQDAHSGSYFVVMPRAERSLQDDLDAGTTFADTEAAAIMLQMASGLSEVPGIVHRDLKPANVLYHDGKWRVADFGIARFVEEATSRRTLKGWLTDEYAAPEQWRFERATHATDIYALGCIGYALLTGQPPFAGPDFRQQHLQEPPPSLQINTPELYSLLSFMLRKIPETRPSLSRVQERLSAIAEKPPKQNVASAESGLEVLAQVGATLAEQAAQEEARQVEKSLMHEKRKEIAMEAWTMLADTFDHLFERAKTVVPTAEARGRQYLDLGKAALMTDAIWSGGPFAPGAFSLSGWDVVAGGIISVHQDPPEPSYVRSASLWYTDLGSGDGVYRWWEVSYFSPADHSPRPNVPYALKDLGEADEAACGLGKHRIATRPRPIDDEDADDFCDRWLRILADACEGKLEYPRRLPLVEED